MCKMFDSCVQKVLFLWGKHEKSVFKSLFFTTKGLTPTFNLMSMCFEYPVEYYLYITNFYSRILKITLLKWRQSSTWISGFTCKDIASLCFCSLRTALGLDWLKPSPDQVEVGTRRSVDLGWAWAATNRYQAHVNPMCIFNLIGSYLIILNNSFDHNLFELLKIFLGKKLTGMCFGR